MVNLSKLTKAELQSTGFKNTSTARNFLKDILKTKAQKYKKDELIKNFHLNSINLKTLVLI